MEISCSYTYLVYFPKKIQTFSDCYAFWLSFSQLCTKYSTNHIQLQIAYSVILNHEINLKIKNAQKIKIEMLGNMSMRIMEMMIKKNAIQVLDRCKGLFA